MRTLVGFIIGAVTVLLLMICFQLFSPVEADNSAEKGQDLISFVQSFREINREALITPLNEAAKTISDPEIADYYHTLLKKCDLLENDVEPLNH